MYCLFCSGFGVFAASMQKKFNDLFWPVSSKVRAVKYLSVLCEDAPGPKLRPAHAG